MSWQGVLDIVRLRGIWFPGFSSQSTDTRLDGPAESSSVYAHGGDEAILVSFAVGIETVHRCGLYRN